MALFDWLTTRALSLLGLDFDFTFDAISEPFHVITPRIALGSRPRPEQVAALKDLGVTHVVSCLPEEDREAVAFLRDDFEALFLPLRDHLDEDLAAHLPRFSAFAAGLGRGERALVHCEVGVSRSASLVIAHVMQSERLRFYEAFRHVRERRAQVLPNIGFASQLQRLERELFPQPRGDGQRSSLARYLREVCNVPVEIEVIEDMLEHNGHDARAAILAIFGEVPRVVQGARRR